VALGERVRPVSAVRGDRSVVALGRACGRLPAGDCLACPDERATDSVAQAAVGLGHLVRLGGETGGQPAGSLELVDLEVDVIERHHCDLLSSKFDVSVTYDRFRTTKLYDKDRTVSSAWDKRDPVERRRACHRGRVLATWSGQTCGTDASRSATGGL
jgi:hypothetical protein